jgi:peptide/nickel transport system substrate-binding protein
MMINLLRNAKTSCILLVVILIAAHVAETSAAATDGKPKYGGTLVAARIGNPVLNAGLTTDSSGQHPMAQFTEPLIYYNIDGTFKPNLAESWDISADGLTYTFHIVKNATWHDGKPFTSADVKFNIETLHKHHPAGAASFDCIKQIGTPDAYTVVIQLKYRFAPFLAALHQKQAPMSFPKHLYEGTDILQNPYNYKPVGTGPFKFKEMVQGSHITLVRNDNYWKKGQPYITKVVFKQLDDPSARALALENHDVDVIPMYTPVEAIRTFEKIPGLVTDPDANALAAPLLWLAFNLRKAPWNDLRVRRAIANSIDKKVIAELTLFGLAGPVDSMIGPGMKWAYNPNVPKYTYDPEVAKQLLDEAGYKEKSAGFRFSAPITYDAARTEIGKTAEIMRDQLKKVGIDLQLQPLDRAAWTDKFFNRWDFDLSLPTYGTGPDPNIGTGRAFHSKNIKRATYVNTQGYNNSRVDLLYDSAEQETDVKKRAQYFYQIQEIIANDLPVIPLTVSVQFTSYWNEWVGLVKPSDGLREGWGDAWWKKGSDLSPESLQLRVADAEKRLGELKGQFYDVTDSMKLLAEAKAALETGDYLKAQQLVDQVTKAAKPPYGLYGGIVAVIVITAGAMLWVRRRSARASSTKKTKT